MGDKFIEIIRSKNSNEVIKPGGFIAPSKDSKDINEIIGIMGTIATDIKKVTENLSVVLGGEAGRDSMSAILANIENLTGSISEISSENKEDIRAIVENIRDVSTTLRAVLDGDNEDKLRNMIANLDKTLSEFSGASAHINRITDKIERGEGSLGRLVNEDDTVDELDGALRDIRTALAPINDMKIVVNTWGEAHSIDTTAAYFNLRFQTRPSTYYLIGFTDAGEDVKDVVISKETTADGSERVVERKRQEAQFRFNAQLAKRWGWFGVRVGLFESTFGGAVDTYFFRDRLRLTAELFDFNSVTDRGADIRAVGRIKAFASLLFYDHVYLMIGLDDVSRYEIPGVEEIAELDYFFGGGLLFNDDDLRALFGLAAVGASTI